MSVGATEPMPFNPALTDEDRQKIQNQLSAPPVPVGVPDSTLLTPSWDNNPQPAPSTGIDSVNPAAVASNIASVGQAPTAPPVSSPPVPPTATQPPAETPKQTDELKAAQTEEAKAREASDKAEIDRQKAAQPAIEEQQRVREQQVNDLKAAAALRQKTQDQYQSAEKAANDQIKQSQDAIKKFKFRDYFDDGEGGTNWARKIGSALAAGLGAYGAGLTHGPNYALQILNKDMDDAHQHQVDQLGKMKDEEVMQRTGLSDIQAARQKALADLTVNDSARDKLVAAQLEQAAARQSSAQFAPSLTAAAAKLKLDAAEKDSVAKKALIDLNLKLQDEDRKKRLDEASIKEKEATANLHGVQAAAGGFAPHHGKGGADGGGGGGVTGDSVSQLKKAIAEGKDGRPLTPNEIQDVANGLHIPAFAKAGRPSVEAITKSVAFVKGQGAKEGAQDTKDIDKRFEGIKREAFGPKGPGTQFERLSGMTSVVDNAIKNNDKTAATAILEEAGGMLSGGKSTRTTVELLEKLKSTRDELESKWGHLTGDPGASKAFTGRLNGLLNSVKEEKRKELDAIRQRAVDTELGEHGLAREGKAKERALGHLGMFNGITNANGQPRYGGQSTPVSDMVTIRNKSGQTKQVTREEAKRLGAL